MTKIENNNMGADAHGELNDMASQIEMSIKMSRINNDTYREHLAATRALEDVLMRFAAIKGSQAPLSGVDQLPDASELYKKSAAFHASVRCLAQGVDPYAIILDLIRLQEDLLQRMETLLRNKI